MKKLTIMLLLTLSLGLLTACGGKKASATSIPEDKVVELVADEEEEVRRPVEETPAEETQAEETSEEPEVTSASNGTPDPALYWRGDGSFNLKGYFAACGGLGYYVDNDPEHRIGVGCFIGKHNVELQAIENPAGIFTRDWQDEDSYMIVSMAEGDTMTPVSIGEDIEVSKECLNTLFVIMPNIIDQKECPFAGTGLAHCDMNGFHND